MTLHDLPAVNGTLNGLSAVFLTAGFVFIKKKNIRAHRNCMISAFVTSIIFLICYLIYHIFVHHLTIFKNPPGFRPIYLTILYTHLAGAFVIVPLVLMTLSRALKQRFDLPAGPGRSGCMYPSPASWSI
jgi:putative membrane protein